LDLVGLYFYPEPYAFGSFTAIPEPQNIELPYYSITGIGVVVILIFTVTIREFAFCTCFKSKRKAFIL